MTIRFLCSADSAFPFYTRMNKRPLLSWHISGHPQGKIPLLIDAQSRSGKDWTRWGELMTDYLIMQCTGTDRYR